MFYSVEGKGEDTNEGRGEEVRGRGEGVGERGSCCFHLRFHLSIYDSV